MISCDGFMNQRQDTFFAIVNEPNVRQLDTVTFSISYKSFDKQENVITVTDTLKLVRPKKEEEQKESQGGRRRKSDAGRESQRQNEEAKKGMFKANLRFEKPYVIETDTMNSKNLVLKTELEPEKQYILEIDDSTFVSVYGTPNLYLSTKVKIRSLDYYGTLSINLKNIGQIEHYPDIAEDLPPFKEIDTARTLRRRIRPSDTAAVSFPQLSKGQLIVCLCNEKGEIRYSKFAKEDSEILFDFIPPADYRVKIIYDENSNGKWDTGKYIENVYPERVIEYDKKQTVKSNWTTKLEWKL